LIAEINTYKPTSDSFSGARPEDNIVKTH